MRLKQSKFVKIRIAVPVSHADIIRQVLGSSGAGRQGNYGYCSGSWKQTGRFKPLDGAKPAIGKIGTLEKVEEEIVETICAVELLSKVIKTVKKVHPYEEPAIDIFARMEIS